MKSFYSLLCPWIWYPTSKLSIQEVAPRVGILSGEQTCLVGRNPMSAPSSSNLGTLTAFNAASDDEIINRAVVLPP